MLKDIRGTVLQPGQTIVVADREGNIGILRLGVIEELVDSYGKVTIRWTDGRPGTKVSTISVEGEYVRRPRMCVVND